MDDPIYDKLQENDDSNEYEEESDEETKKKMNLKICGT